MMMTINDGERCGLCGKSFTEHGLMNHEFSPSGQLVTKAKQESPKTTIAIVPDYPLRALLMDLGIITGQQMMEKEAEFRDKLSRSSSNAPTSTGDKSDRSRKIPNGGLRGTSTSPSTPSETRISGSRNSQS